MILFSLLSSSFLASIFFQLLQECIFILFCNHRFNALLYLLFNKLRVERPLFLPISLLLMSFLNSLSILGISFSQILCLQIFSPILSVPFHFIRYFLCCAETSQVDVIHIETKKGVFQFFCSFVGFRSVFYALPVWGHYILSWPQFITEKPKISWTVSTEYFSRLVISCP